MNRDFEVKLKKLEVKTEINRRLVNERDDGYIKLGLWIGQFKTVGVWLTTEEVDELIKALQEAKTTVQYGNFVDFFKTSIK